MATRLLLTVWVSPSASGLLSRTGLEPEAVVSGFQDAGSVGAEADEIPMQLLGRPQLLAGPSCFTTQPCR